MEKTEFLEKNIFLNLKNLNNEIEIDSICYFSEDDFALVLERVEQFGLGIYKIEPRLEGVAIEGKINEDYRKKATDPKWYKRAFFELKKQQTGLEYSATYRVSERLLNKEIKAVDTSDKK